MKNCLDTSFILFTIKAICNLSTPGLEHNSNNPEAVRFDDCFASRPSAVPLCSILRSLYFCRPLHWSSKKVMIMKNNLKDLACPYAPIYIYYVVWLISTLIYRTPNII